MNLWSALLRRRRFLLSLPLCALALGLTGCDPETGGGSLGNTGVVGPGRGNTTMVPSTAAFAIVDVETGYLLDYRDANRKLQVGSLAKIATTLVVQNWLEATRTSAATPVTIPQSAFMYGGPNPLALQPGDQMTVRDLQYAALMNSDNVSAFALAEFVGTALIQQGYGSGAPQQAFVGQMNGLAQQLGMTNTAFTNAAGIDGVGGREPYSSVVDMARLTRSAITRPSFQFAVSQVTRQVSIQRGGQSFAYTLRNTNELLGQGAIDGVKTGYTALAGGCVILDAERPPKVWQEGETFYRINRRLIVVVLGSNNRFNDGMTLMNYGWSMHDTWLNTNRPMDEGRKL